MPVGEKTLSAVEQPVLKKRSQTRDILRRFRKNKLAMLGLVIILVFILVAIFAEQLAPYGYDEIDMSARLEYPSADHLLGTDELGRDLLSRIIYGARVSLLVALLGVAISIVTGGIIGAIAGYFGGTLEGFIMRTADILMAVPPMLLAICISTALGTGTFNTALAISVSGIASAIRLMRAMVMTIRGQEYVEAARANGSGHMRLIFRQILPNTISPLIVDATLRLGGNILAISGLSFIGLGVQVPIAEWGAILNAGRTYILVFYPMVTFPGIAILLAVFGFNMLGDGLRDALDPKMKN